MEIIPSKDKNAKIMVFSNFTETFNKIQNKLVEEKISYGILKGTEKQIRKQIDDFSAGRIRILMLNAQYFGAGLNLQMATDVILYHRFERELEEQVISRAQRIGRTTQLNVYYLLHNNEQIIQTI